jgi:hypothetical protein
MVVSTIRIVNATINSISVNPRCFRRETRVTPIVFPDLPAFQSLANPDALTTIRLGLL